MDRIEMTTMAAGNWKEDDEMQKPTEQEQHERTVSDIRKRFESALYDWSQIAVPVSEAERELSHLKFANDDLTKENIQLMKNTADLQNIIRECDRRISEQTTAIKKLRALNDDLQTTVRAVRAALVDRGEL